MAVGIDWWHAFGGGQFQLWTSPTMSIDQDEKLKAYIQLHDLNAKLLYVPDANRRESMTCLDYRKVQHTASHGVDVMSTADVTWDEFKRRLATSPPSNTFLRLIVVQDISYDYSVFLGSLFGISPEVVSEHVYNPSDKRHPMLRSSTKGRPFLSSSQKNWCSTTWYRPVVRNERSSTKATARQELVKEGTVRWEKVRSKYCRDVTVRCTVEYVLERVGRVLRPEWSTTTGKDKNTALQEKLTVWVRQFKSCKIGQFFCCKVPSLLLN